MRERLSRIEACETLKDNWVRECLINNITQIISDVEEIRRLKSDPNAASQTLNDPY
jgi:hypothetical protein